MWLVGFSYSTAIIPGNARLAPWDLDGKGTKRGSQKASSDLD